jgi:hypothetical protein
MTGFRFLFSKSVVASMDSLDHELKEYFRESTSFRSRVRNGTVVIVDRQTDLFDFLRDLTTRFQLKFQVVQVDDAENARRMLSEIGQRRVKVVVINSSLIFGSESGGRLVQWVSEWFPEIPVWVIDCPPERDAEVHKLSQRIGILRTGEPFSEYIDILGFPARCREQMTEPQFVTSR